MSYNKIVKQIVAKKLNFNFNFKILTKYKNKLLTYVSKEMNKAKKLGSSISYKVTEKVDGDYTIIKYVVSSDTGSDITAFDDTIDNFADLIAKDEWEFEDLGE
jgi:hypothetical protein